jgi:adenylate kinase family enzyme
VDRVSVQGVPGSGKSTVGRALAERLDAPYIELDALHHGPNWSEPTAEEFLAVVQPLVEQPRWVIDGRYHGKLGDLVISHADTVVWLDVPLRTWLPRLARRSLLRLVRRERLWNGNRERVRDQFEFFRWAWQKHVADRTFIPEWVGAYPHVRLVRLGTQREVHAFVEACDS